METVAARALAYIRSNDGCSVGDIATALRLTTKDLRLPILKLLEDKKIRTTGQRRGTRYHASGLQEPAKKRKTTSGGAEKDRAQDVLTRQEDIPRNPTNWSEALQDGGRVL